MYYAHLTRKKRYQIESLLAQGIAVELIARKVGFDRSTVYREIKRNAKSKDQYRAVQAQEAALRRARRSAANHPTKPAVLWRRVQELVRRDWSPEQVRGWLLRWGLPAASVPAIYTHIRYSRASLHEHLRYGRRRIPWGLYAGGAGLPRGRLGIRQRPKEAALRRDPGHWEGDTLMGRRGSTHKLLALTERASRYLVLRRPARFDLMRTVIQGLRRMPLKTLTFDNGSEFAQYMRVTQSLGVKVYFADPGRPGQRGTCENTIGLVRQYVPKGTSGAHLSDKQIHSIAQKLNNRPRKCLGFRTPNEVLFNKPPVALRS
jgi:IS30 family transposase